MCGKPAVAGASCRLTSSSNLPVISPLSSPLSLSPDPAEAARRAARVVRFADQTDTGVTPGARSRFAHPGSTIISSDAAARLAALITRKLHSGVGLIADQEWAVRIEAASRLVQGAPVAAV